MFFSRNSRCHYMEGGCMSSPRWTSILVAEIYYPGSFLPPKPKPTPSPPSSDASPPPVQDFQNYQQYLQKRAGTASEGAQEENKNTHCDGVDEIGCFQVSKTLFLELPHLLSGSYGYKNGCTEMSYFCLLCLLFHSLIELS